MLDSRVRILMLPPTATIREAITAMSAKEGGIVLVTDEEEHLLGIVVDSDIRKAFLKGLGLDSPLQQFMTGKPFTLPYGTNREKIRAEFNRHPRAFIPLVDEEGRVRGLGRLYDFIRVDKERPNLVFLMAGGMGTRLMPITNDRPKPMVPVGDRPILETIIAQFVTQGFKRFIIAVNHLSDQIREHFQDGSPWGARIEYLEEQERLGTAGALSLIERKLDSSLIVMNADLLTNIDFNTLLDFHGNEGGKATVCVREYNIEIPFGVVNVEEGRMASVDEKPVQRFFVNAGICVLEPETLSLLRKAERIDMPLFLERIHEWSPRSVACFPITEYWLDIGRFADYEKAQKEFNKVFKK